MVMVLGILGSPREQGNTEILLDEALRGAGEAGAATGKLKLAGLDFAGCSECEECYVTGQCSIEDDMDIVYDALERADRILLASPIFFMGLPSQAKAMIDRTQRYWALKYLLKEDFPAQGTSARYGSFIGVGATRGKQLFDGTILTLKYFFDAIAVKPLRDSYLLVRGVDEKGEIRQREGIPQSAARLGTMLATRD